jgi:hypothetical protein
MGHANEPALALDAHASLKKLKGMLRGRIIEPGDGDFDSARKVFNGWVDRRPSVIVRAADASDVMHTVRCAREQDLRLAIRSGGHDLAGNSAVDDGIVLDMRDLNSLDIDTATNTAWAGAGLNAGAYTAAAARHGLATGFGDTANVGIAGITLGGGVGFLVRKYGLTIDQLLAAEIVTADGQLLFTDATHHPDLFWAIRGGGGNFGVVTRLRFQLHPVDRVFGGILILPATVESLTSFVAAVDAAPGDLSVIANVMHAPPMPFIPREHVGTPVIMAMMVYAGALEQAERVVAPLRTIAAPVVDLLRPMHYPEMYQMGAPEPGSVAVRSFFLDTFDQRTAQTIFRGLQTATTPTAAVQLRVLGGAVSRIQEGATAYAHRSRRIMAGVLAMYDRPETRPLHEAWASAVAEALGEGQPGVYVNFLSDEGATRVREAYPGPTWHRLRQVKHHYDPTNFFRMNQNIPPASA